MNEQYLSPKTTAEILSTSVQRLANLRSKGFGPAYSKIGSAIRYSRTDIDLFMEANRVIPHSGGLA